MEKKKLIKKQKEKIKEVFELTFAEDNLKHKKNVYKTYLGVLVKYNIVETAHSAIKYDEDFHDKLQHTLKKLRNNKKSFMSFMFGEPEEKKPTELEKIEKNIKYYDELINSVGSRIEGFSDNIKMKIAEDSIEKQKSYFGLFKYDENFKPKNKIEKNGKGNRKNKKK